MASCAICGGAATINDAHRGDVCHAHRRWSCPSCGDVAFTALSDGSSDGEAFLHCPTCSAVLWSDFFAWVAKCGDLDRMCRACLGYGTCRICARRLASHERCLSCGGSFVCASCADTGVR